jgi:hypothetical protein
VVVRPCHTRAMREMVGRSVYARSETKAQTRTRIHTRTRAHTHTNTNTNTHKHTHTHTSSTLFASTLPQRQSWREHTATTSELASCALS